MTAVVERPKTSPPAAPVTAPPGRDGAVPAAPPRPPAAPRRTRPVHPSVRVAQGVLASIAALVLGFAVNLVLISPLTQDARQEMAFDRLRQELAEGSAPVSELDGDGRMLADGRPLAMIDIPQLGVHEVVVEGTTSGVLTTGPGHRRDTVLPGQEGTSILLGRAGAYGAPFGRIQELAPGETFTVTTGQGTSTFEVMGQRYAGDASPPPPEPGESRLVLVTARGPAFMPAGVLRVDARVVSEVHPAGERITTAVSRAVAGEPMVGDVSTVWALVFWLQGFVVAAFGAVWSYHRWGHWQTWVVFAPAIAAVAFQVADQVTRLLPNLL